jgi:hypothetical protein
MTGGGCIGSWVADGYAQAGSIASGDIGLLQWRLALPPELRRSRGASSPLKSNTQG